MPLVIIWRNHDETICISTAVHEKQGKQLVENSSFKINLLMKTMVDVCTLLFYAVTNKSSTVLLKRNASRNYVEKPRRNNLYNLYIYCRT
jgi:hypothetical protein